MKKGSANANVHIFDRGSDGKRSASARRATARSHPRNGTQVHGIRTS
ncbi:hypothetical protein DPPLL_08620 [Desulfofustis limnaeus]|uniref:Uncharacterized protein n=1 Tax=Desulfofustis limnaeus TaxID=2740163 RepID=A0ABN6M0R4_9BACT|nr:hypothetical protein DPPLL_08620 [Desulfofustis limnaeus]